MRNFPSIKKNEDFKKVYRKGKSCANDALIMYVLPNDLTHDRIGISASKKIGNSITRHRIARVVRECFRLHSEEVKSGFDIVVVAREPAAMLGYNEMSLAYLDLCSRMGILL